MLNLWKSPTSRLIRLRLSTANYGYRTTAWNQQLKLQNHSRTRQFTLNKKQVRRKFSSSSQWPPPVGRPRSSQQGKTIRSSDGYSHFGNGNTPNKNSAAASPIFRYILIIGGGYTVYKIYSCIDYAPFTGRFRLMGGISRESEIELGKEAYEDLLMSFNGRILPAKHPTTQRVRRIVARLAGTIRKMDPKLCEDFKWSIAVADIDEPNAMCVPGGRIVITTGLLQILYNDDDIAVILAHEITHALNRHGVESLSLRRLLWPLIFIINQIFDMRIFPSIIATVFLQLPYSRNLEYEADTVGILLCTEACYNPSVAPDVFKRLAQLQNEMEQSNRFNSKVASMFSTHPHTLDRAKRLEKKMPEQLSRYNNKCVHSSDFRNLHERY